MKSCLVLLSGGLDSTTALYWALRRFESTTAVSFDYGQKHRAELRVAGRIARAAGVERIVLKVNLARVGGSALTDRRIPVPRYRAAADIPAGPPSTYVPFRNGIFLSLAAALAEARGITAIVSGFNVLDSPDYPDTRPEFVRAMEKAVNLGTRAAFGGPRIMILAPFVGLKKSEIIRRGLELGVDYSHTMSCYAGGEVPCGACSSCLLRERAWKKAGLRDPLLVRLKKEGKI